MKNTAAGKDFDGASGMARAALQAAAHFFRVPPDVIHPLLVSLAGSVPGGGYWRADLEAGLFYWSPEVFALFGSPPHDGPLDFAAQIALYHPDDRSTVLDLIDQVAEQRCGYSYNLRVRPRMDGRADHYVYIRSEARFHEDRAGRRILGAVGLCDDHVCFAHLVR